WQIATPLGPGWISRACACPETARGGGPHAAFHRCRTFSWISPHAAPLGCASWGDRMTRSTLKRTLRRVYALLIVVLGISFLAKVADHVPLLAGSGLEKFLKDAYEYLRDMSLLIATGGVAYITNMFQKRSSFVE